MTKLIVETSIIIEASATRVWEVFTEFESYPDWNPFLTYVKGTVSEGQKLEINAGGMRFTPIVLSYKPEKELKWLGSLLFRGLFDGEHHFFIETMDGGKVSFHQNESFSGLLVGMFRKKLNTDTKAGFIAMNQKLKELCERV